MAYSPEMGVWLQQDPERYVDGMNLYQYELSEPTERLDPTGTETQRYPTMPPPTSIPPVLPMPPVKEPGKMQPMHTARTTRKPASGDACPFSGLGPIYSPNRWNIDDDLGWRNNCYSYACNNLNNMSPRVPQPGKLGNDRPKQGDKMDCPTVSRKAQKDGLLPWPCDYGAPPGYYKVMLFVDPGHDFHWYRQNCDGSWSNKPGASQPDKGLYAPVTYLDASMKPIRDPRTADRNYGPGNNYTDPGGCFIVPSGGIPVR